MIFDWRVILDIVLIAAGLFFLYRTLKSLGTWKIVAGIILAMVVFVVANVLDLKGIGWIYSNLSQVAVIALIIIFQPELRKVFERAVSPRRHEIGEGGADLSLVIGDAVFNLAEQRRGAIIVFPGKEPIQEWLSGGLPLNGDPTFPIILSIFDPHSLGHDGALVIENGRLTSFGVRLPLSRSDRLPGEMGTRHHAAMGLSEMCDALVVVVSEERGTVTTFQAGSFAAERRRRELEKRIVDHWEDTASYAPELHKKKEKKGLFAEMAISVALAFVFWITVVITQAEVRGKAFIVPVEYVSTPKHLALVGEKPTEVKLSLSGPKWELDDIEPSQLSVKIDLSQVKAGQQVFDVSEANIDLPNGVKLVETEPSLLTLSLKEFVERQVTVQPQLVGSLPNGLALTSVEVEPRDIQILSPAGDERQPGSLITTPIYLESINGDVEVVSKIIAPVNIQPVDKPWPEVKVRIKVRPKQ
jgi:DNA integrity scanning protein DisA with diadenylate cyclase activity